MTIDNASPIEVAYTVVMIIAFVYSVANCLWGARQVREITGSDREGPLMVLRRGARNDQGRIAVMAGCQVLIGIVSVVSPPQPRALSTAAAIDSVAFLVLSAMTLWLSISIRVRPSQVWTSARKRSTAK